MLILFYFLEIFLVCVLFYFIFINLYAIFKGAPYMASTNHRAKVMVEALNLKPGQKAADLGCGDGLLLIEMAKRGIEAHGYEINPFMVLIAKFRAKKAMIFAKDFWLVDLSKYDGITVYLLPQAMEKLEKKLRRELKPGAVVVTQTWKFPTWKPAKVIEDYVFVYNK